MMEFRTLGAVAAASGVSRLTDPMGTPGFLDAGEAETVSVEGPSPGTADAGASLGAAAAAASRRRLASARLADFSCIASLNSACFRCRFVMPDVSRDDGGAAAASE